MMTLPTFFSSLFSARSRPAPPPLTPEQALEVSIVETCRAMTAMIDAGMEVPTAFKKLLENRRAQMGVMFVRSKWKPHSHHYKRLTDRLCTLKKVELRLENSLHGAPPARNASVTPAKRGLH